MPLAEVVRRRLGVLKGGRVLAFMVQWDLVARELGRDPTQAEYAAWWGESERSVRNHLGRFRECFPGERTPGRLMGQLRGAWDERRGVRGLGAARLELEAA